MTTTNTTNNTTNNAKKFAVAPEMVQKVLTASFTDKGAIALHGEALAFLAEAEAKPKKADREALRSKAVQKYLDAKGVQGNVDVKNAEKTKDTEAKRVAIASAKKSMTAQTALLFCKEHFRTIVTYGDSKRTLCITRVPRSAFADNCAYSEYLRKLENLHTAMYTNIADVNGKCNASFAIQMNALAKLMGAESFKFTNKEAAYLKARALGKERMDDATMSLVPSMTSAEAFRLSFEFLLWSHLNGTKIEGKFTEKEAKRIKAIDERNAKAKADAKQKQTTVKQSAKA